MSERLRRPAGAGGDRERGGVSGVGPPTVGSRPTASEAPESGGCAPRPKGAQEKKAPFRKKAAACADTLGIDYKDPRAALLPTETGKLIPRASRELPKHQRQIARDQARPPARADSYATGRQ
jgi:ribosomal protein S18